MRVRAVVAYDGTDYVGFQRQTNGPTVQQALETALAQVTRQTVTIVAAGRTDSGVHALGQVIAFDLTGWRHDLSDLQRAMNALLPSDIAIFTVEQTEPDFHPRYTARSRRYRYTIYNAPVRSPLARRYSWHISTPLEIEAMQQAASLLVGEHDYAAFGRPPQGTNSVRQVLAAEWSREGRRLMFDIEANAFLYRMVRSIVATLVSVGRGTLNRAEFSAVLESRDRGRAGPTAPPQGLCLMEIKY